MFDDWFWLMLCTSVPFSVITGAAMLVLLWPQKEPPDQTPSVPERINETLQIYLDAASAFQNTAADVRPTDGSHL